MFAEVAVDIPLFAALTYRVGEEIADVVRPGQLVQVPFRNKAKTGVIIGLTDQLADESLRSKIRDISDVIDLVPLLPESSLKFLRFVSDYYFAPIGEVVKMAVPAAVRVEGIKHYKTRAEQAPWDDLSPALEKALEIAADEPVNVRELAEGLNTTFRELSELERLELVDVTYVDESSVSAKTEKWYELDGEGDGGRLGSKQSEILAFLAEGEARLADIRERFPSPYSSLASLEERGYIKSREEEIYRDPFKDSEIKEPGSFEATQGQEAALKSLISPIEDERFEAFVLHGVTGSGKTEVYVRAIKRALSHGRRALILLPEIALTPQFVSVFRGHFGDELAVLHSGLSTAEKFDQWRRIQRNEVDIVIGARSAVFAPVDKLGVIVVDEEHDTSFKQEDGTRYNARDLALMRGKLEDAVVILGSATPSLESFHNAKLGKMTYLEMPERVSGRAMPQVEMVDMRGRSRGESGVGGTLSEELRTAMQRGFEDELQTILFLNRRGYSPCVICDECGHRWTCPNCDVSLTYHRRQESLRCHHCDYSLRLPEHCPECGEFGVGPKGIGTEQLEELLRKLYPQSEIGRLDRDTGRGSGLRRIIRAFSRGQIDVLVGTQMVTKGHDFPGVTTVGVVSADQSLNFPDFRSSERTFQLMAQVAGRAGRGDDAGSVFIQALNPEHYSLQCAIDHDFKTFSERELAIRKELRYPPFTHMIAIKFEAASDAAVVQAARDYAFSARRIARHHGRDDVLIVGPALAPFERLRGRMRYQLLLRSEDRSSLRKLVHATLSKMEYFELNSRKHKNVRIAVDVDPMNLL